VVFPLAVFLELKCTGKIQRISPIAGEKNPFFQMRTSHSAHPFMVFLLLDLNVSDTVVMMVVVNHFFFTGI